MFYCAKIQAPIQAIRSDSQASHLQPFVHADFSMPNSKVKFLGGTPSHTPIIPSKKKCKTTFGSPFSVSSEEFEYCEKIDGNERMLQKGPLETYLHDLFQIDEN